jgi:putative chitinase
MNAQTQKLKGLIPANALAEVDAVLDKRGLTNTQLAAFLAQVSHESAAFARTVENLNYSEAGLLKTFGSKFAGVAAQYARKPEKIANRAYANKGGNGNEASGDGWKYRGRGYIQLTLKNNYQHFSATVPEDIMANPDLVATKYAIESAIWFFDANKLWVLASDPATFSALTGKINPAKLGLKERTTLFNKFLKALG